MNDGILCPNQIALCKMHNCATCSFHGDEVNCPFFDRSSILESTPTFRQMLEIYCAGTASRRRQHTVVGNVKNDLAEIGLSLDDKYTMLTRQKFKMLIASLKDENRRGGPLRDLTVRSHLDSFKAIASNAFEDRFEEAGFLQPQFNIPKFDVKRPKVQEISDDQARQFNIQMEKWLATGKPSDRDAFVYSFFYKYCGMRAGDICAAKWDVLKQTSIGIMLVYTPHKTLKSSGKTVSFPLNNKIYCMIKPLIGAPDEYVIPRHENRRPKKLSKGERCGEYEGMHNYLRKKVNKALAAIGVGNEYRGQKKAHALRKYFETDMAFCVGKETAAAYAGHTLAVQARNYLGTQYGKVS